MKSTGFGGDFHANSRPLYNLLHADKASAMKQKIKSIYIDIFFLVYIEFIKHSWIYVLFWDIFKFIINVNCVNDENK